MNEQVVNMARKRAGGVFYTQENPFDCPAFKKWAKSAKLKSQNILEPFAGTNALVAMLKGMDLCAHSTSYDIMPAAPEVKKRDTLADFPSAYDVCVTNPPWLAKNSATARGLPFPDTHYDDIYKLALEKCLENCGWVAALVPESFIRADVLQERLVHFVSLTDRIFADTDNPVGLALFQPTETQDVMVWRNSDKIGCLSEIKRARPHKTSTMAIRFNDPDGNLGLIAIDNTKTASIRFCSVAALDGYEVKPSCRMITKISVDGRVRIRALNDCLDMFRAKTQDVLLTCFKGVRADGFYRRRLDWQTARGIINYAGSV